MRTSHRAVEIATAVVLVLLGVLIFWESLRLGPGWGVSGPQPGFFPFVLTLMVLIGVLGVLYVNIYRHPDTRPFFEVSQEVTDLLKVGVPIFFAVLAIRWLGLYITSGLYLAFFMAWYGKFRWWQAILGGILLPLIMWVVLRQGFNIAMPMSMFYRMNILPI
ncbi:MAG TPA: tripartite tricarboxylate transporter TctB family protein [Afifellaceae bacterium]|nr:tripartite tricarboxylate transporter TctB family protein [Afifellaceae bacterium]